MKPLDVVKKHCKYPEKKEKKMCLFCKILPVSYDGDFYCSEYRTYFTQTELWKNVSSPCRREEAKVCPLIPEAIRRVMQ